MGDGTPPISDASNTASPTPRKLTPKLSGIRRAPQPTTVYMEQPIQRSRSFERHPVKLRDGSPVSVEVSTMPAMVPSPPPLDVDALLGRLSPMLEAMERRLHERCNAIEHCVLERLCETQSDWADCQAMLGELVNRHTPANAIDMPPPVTETTPSLPEPQLVTTPASVTAEYDCAAKVLEAVQELKQQAAAMVASRAQPTKKEAPMWSDADRHSTSRASGDMVRARDIAATRPRSTSRSLAMATRASKDSATTELWDSDRLIDADTESETIEPEVSGKPRSIRERVVKKVGHMLEALPKHQPALELAGGAWFRNASLLVTLVNCLVIAIDVDLEVDRTLLQLQGIPVENDPTIKGVLLGFQVAFVLWMVFELGVKFHGKGGGFFFGGDRMWSFLDVVVLVVSVIELLGSGLQLSFLRAVRVLKGMKAIQAVRFIRFNYSMHKMASALTSLAMTCFWAMTLLFLLLYIIGLILMAGVAAWATSAIDADRRLLAFGGGNYTASTPFVLPQGSVLEDLQAYYGSVGRTLITLLRAISGADWGAFAAPVASVNWFLGMVWLAYILVILVGFFHVVTAIIVDQVRKPTTIDRTIHLMEEEQEERKLREVVSKELAKSGKDESSQLSEKFFHKLLAREPMIRQLEAAGIYLEGGKARDLFKAVDIHGIGSVTAPDLVRQLINLRGEAKSRDLNLLRAEVHQLEHVMDTVFEAVQNIVDRMEDGGLVATTECEL